MLQSCISIFICLIFSNFFFDFFIDRLVFLGACCLISLCFFFSHFSFCDRFLDSYHCSWENARYNFYPLKFVETCFVLWPNPPLIYPGECSMFTWKKKFIMLFMDVMSYRYLLSPTDLLLHLNSLLSEWSVHRCKGDVKVSYYYCIVINFPFMSFIIYCTYLSAPTLDESILTSVLLVVLIPFIII